MKDLITAINMIVKLQEDNKKEQDKDYTKVLSLGVKYLELVDEELILKKALRILEKYEDLK